MALTWTDIENGESLLSIRGKINTFNTAAKAQVNLNESGIATLDSRMTTAESTITTNTANIATNTATIANHETRLVAQESHHALLIMQESLVDQNPTGLGDANKIQVNFGAGGSVTDVTINSAGVITFNTSGKYLIRFEAHYGRTGSTGASVIAYRSLYNGVPTDELHVAKLDNSDIIVPFVGTYMLDVSATDYITMEIMRDATGDNSGGMVAPVVTWGTGCSARVEVYRVG